MYNLIEINYYYFPEHVGTGTTKHSVFVYHLKYKQNISRCRCCNSRVTHVEKKEIT